MKRVQLFEFEDYDWFPRWLRACMTNLLAVLNRLMGLSEAIAKILAPIIKEGNEKSIVDLGSGSGGQMPKVLESLKAQTHLESLRLTLTDLYPNKAAIEKYKTIDHVVYHEHPVDATDFTSAPTGIKTMINCFHHMPPVAARQILASAQQNKQALLIFEMADNKIPFLVWLILLPLSLLITMLMAVLLTPFVRPMTWRQLVFTFLIPIIPICYAWDGQASMPRIYNHADMDLLLEALPKTEGYRWQKGFGEGKNGKKMGIYLLGLPA